jgi:hypothetical protein
MNHGNDRTSASGLLHELDDIRSLLEDALPDDAIPVLEDAVEIVEPAAPPTEDATGFATEAPLDAADLAHIPLLQDAIPEVVEDEAFDESFDATLDEYFDKSYDESCDESPDARFDEPFGASLDAESGPSFDDEALEKTTAFGDYSFEPDLTPPAAHPGPAPFPPGATVTELLAAQELQTAIRNRIDATFEHWLNDTLQQELNLLRARLLEAVRAEVHEFVTQQINRTNPTGRPHGE